ncbi:UDP-N-acetylmuramate--L-alanine ligase [Mongoliitalea daihaiensis]|uniref:UDP-N-acetylmuramate--L-alanine ligase n=1 Tax=Mongoliitalea daihaiensis TaxID=2782006 RepID=UPI001F3ADD27|nr:UDP-N-acetylmuramate--L-alanine ligase [Mongoliitalea daihaiensis]UJP66565.1 UDP-N-acetylmuramate--L-alanine ligase [Mongoliitalea daihaiensis]
MNLRSIHRVHFVGIGGIGMSAIARWFNHLGKVVTGYDRTPSALTDALKAEGMCISFEDDVNQIPLELKNAQAESLIVWTPAIPKDSIQLNYFRTHGYKLLKRAEVLGVITLDMPTIAVAGTHGKTTTSSMIAHLLKVGGVEVSAFLGGLTQNYQSNLILPDHTDSGSVVVVEADEFDRSFLQLHPNSAILTSVDPDHLDIYGDGIEMLHGFKSFVELIPSSGSLYVSERAYQNLSLDGVSIKDIHVYGLDKADYTAENITPTTGSFIFDYVSPSTRIERLELHMPGYHNVENAVAAIAMALEYGVTADAVRTGVYSFRGVKRRFEILVQKEGKVFIDDYAHHPEEIKAFLSSVKAMYPNRKLTAVFQPHLFSRTRDFASGFSKSLSLADEVILLDIYPARELPIEGVHASMLLDAISSKEKSLQSKESLIGYLQNHQPEVLVTIGAGDIDRMVDPLTKFMLGV